MNKISLKHAGLTLGLMLAAGCQHQGTEQAAVSVNAAPTQASQQQAQQTIITVHLAQQQPDPALVTLELGANNKLYALPQPILTQADMQRVVPATAKDGSTYLLFDMTPEGSKKLADISRQAQGHFFLISAKGQLISIAQIGEPMTDGKLLISTNGAEHTQQLIKMLRE